MGCSEYFYSWLYNRSRNGAGALMDYCCYGANMARHWLGAPNSVIGMADRLVKTDIDVDDNAIILMKYPHAFATAEASWTQVAPDGEHSGLQGYAYDGFGIFGVYGEDGELLSTADLDECHGHTHEIEWDGETGFGITERSVPLG